jgi:small GTP-binding protein
MSFHTKLDYQYKLLFLGETSVGKTSLLIRFTDGKFDEDKSLPTLGVDVRYKYIILEEKKIRLDIWDTAGQERFKNITKNYLQGANGIILVCDVTNKDSFDKLKTWLNDAQMNVSTETEMIIVGNKIDLIEKRKVKFETLKEFGDKHNIDVFEVSAKTGEGVEDIFSNLTKKLFEKKHIGVVLPGEDELSMRRGSYILQSESGKKNNKNEGNGCNC